MYPVRAKFENLGARGFVFVPFISIIIIIIVLHFFGDVAPRTFVGSSNF